MLFVVTLLKNSFRLSWLYGGFNGSRMLVGAINSMFLLRTGVTLGQLAVLQIVFSIGVLVLEFPTGFIGDMFSKKLSVLISVVCMSTYYLMCLTAPNMYLLILSQIIYAMGMCLASGSLEGWIIDTSNYEYNFDKDKINYFGYLRNEVLGLISMFAGPAGCFLVYLYNKSYSLLYILTAVVMVLFFIAFSLIPCKDKFKIKSFRKNKEISSKAITIFKELKICLTNKNGLYYLAISSCLAATYQVIFFYWQPFFIQISKSKKSNISLLNNEAVLLGVIFFVYSLSKLLINKYVRKNMERINLFKLSLSASILCAILIILVSFSNNFNIIFSILVFGLFQGLLSIVDITTQCEFLKSVPEGIIASSLSAINAVTRLLSLIMLWIISIAITNNTINKFFMSTSLLYITIFALIYLWNKHIRRNLNDKLVSTINVR